MVFDLFEEPGGVEIGDHLFSRGEAVEAAIGRRRRVVDPRIRVEDVQEHEAVASPDLEIVEIVGRGDLDRTAAGLGVGIFVGNDRDQPAGERQAHRFADEIGKARVVRMHRDSGVAEHGFRPGRRHRDEPAGKLGHRIADMP